MWIHLAEWSQGQSGPLFCKFSLPFFTQNTHTQPSYKNQTLHTFSFPSPSPKCQWTTELWGQDSHGDPSKSPPRYLAVFVLVAVSEVVGEDCNSYESRRPSWFPVFGLVTLSNLNYVNRTGEQWSHLNLSSFCGLLMGNKLHIQIVMELGGSF